MARRRDPVAVVPDVAHGLRVLRDFYHGDPRAVSQVVDWLVAQTGMGEEDAARCRRTATWIADLPECYRDALDVGFVEKDGPGGG